MEEINKPEIKDAVEIASENYKEYSLYVGQARVYGMSKHSPRSIVKVAKLTRRCCCLSSASKFNIWSNSWSWK